MNINVIEVTGAELKLLTSALRSVPRPHEVTSADRCLLRAGRAMVVPRSHRNPEGINRIAAGSLVAAGVLAGLTTFGGVAAADPDMTHDSVSPDMTHD